MLIMNDNEVLNAFFCYAGFLIPFKLLLKGCGDDLIRPSFSFMMNIKIKLGKIS